MSKLEGRNLFEWRAEYVELSSLFVQYADHTYACSRLLHKHDVPERHLDERIVCNAAPCTCGLLVVLSVLNPTVTYGMECPDAPARAQRRLRALTTDEMGIDS